MSELTERASALLSGRVKSIEVLESAGQRVALLHEQMHQAQREMKESWVAANAAGWTDAELRQLGISKPAGPGRPRGSRTKNARRNTAAGPTGDHD